MATAIDPALAHPPEPALTPAHRRLTALSRKLGLTLWCGNPPEGWGRKHRYAFRLPDGRPFVTKPTELAGRAELQRLAAKGPGSGCQRPVSGLVLRGPMDRNGNSRTLWVALNSNGAASFWERGEGDNRPPAFDWVPCCVVQVSASEFRSWQRSGHSQYGAR
jgi:hypothetical protein